MIEYKNLSLGAKVYIANSTSNAFSRKKIYKVDADGVKWFRYDKELFEYSINELVYCGKVTHVIQGEVASDERYDTEYHFKYQDGKIYYEQGESEETWFYTRKEAEACIKEWKKTRAE